MDEEDGILTAQEIAAMDLGGVEFVVLSACDTGLGEHFPGEGILGLRRAFRRAGADSVVMSLWPVDDATTRDWMVEMYRARLMEKEDIIGAIMKADLNQLNSNRDDPKEHPFYWAGFVASGNWRY